MTFRTLAGFMFVALAFALPSMSMDFSQEPTRLGSGWVGSIAFSPDGTILAAWHWVEGAVLLWDAQTLELVGKVKDDMESIKSIAFSPDSTLLALGGNDISLWEVAGQSRVGVMRTPTTWSVMSVAFSPDGKTLASSGSGENVIRLWNVQTQQQIGALIGHNQNNVWAVAFSPDGRLLASGGWRGDETIRLWDVETQKQVGELIGHLHITNYLAFSPDGQILASAGGWLDKAVYLWDVQTQTQIGVLGGLSAHVGSVAFSPNGRLLASTVNWDNTIYLWDVERQEQIGVLKGHDATDEGNPDRVAFSPDGTWLACGGDNGVELWEVNLPGLTSRAYAFDPRPDDGSYHEDTWVNLKWRAGDFAVSHDVYFGDNFEDVNAGAESTFQGNQTDTFFLAGFPGFPYPEGLVQDTTYYWRIDEVNDADPNSPWKGDIWNFSIAPKIAYFPKPADGAVSVNPIVTLTWTAGLGAKLHTVYFGDNFDDVNNAVDGLQQGNTSYTPGPLKLTENYYWRIDEFDTITTHKGNVWSFTTKGAVGNPIPANGAVDVTQTPILSWNPGIYSSSHEVYFGTDKEAIKNADTSSVGYKGSGNLGSESYEPGQLEWNTTYYWRIDDVNNANADSPWKGPLWSFTTANFLIVDDFESYNDLLPANPASNRIFEKWLDGFDNATVNGSIVGYANPPFAEQTIVHGGGQSMPFEYNNAAGKSEATLTLTSNRDWTINGVNTLTIWFRGSVGNAAEQMYVTLNGNARIDHDDPDAATSTSWKEWNIDLQAFADQGVNLSNVNSVTLGLGNRNNPVAGGWGMMYFDDIRLYPPGLVP